MASDQLFGGVSTASDGRATTLWNQSCSDAGEARTAAVSIHHVKLIDNGARLCRQFVLDTPDDGYWTQRQKQKAIMTQK